MVVDRAKTRSANLNVNDKVICKCCSQVDPTEDHLYSLSVKNNELGELGPGFPLLFDLMKQVIILLLILTIIYFVPCCFLILKSFNKIHEADLPDDGLLASFSNAIALLDLDIDK
jgi:hypothetical protein